MIMDAQGRAGMLREMGAKPGARYRDPATLAILSIGSTVGGTILSAAGSIRQGQEAKAAAETQAMQAERAADEQRAEASRAAAEKYKEQQRLLSDQTAVAAASGGSATDPSVLNLAGQVGGFGYQQRQGILANGENIARGYDDRAIAKRASGKSALTAGYIGATSSILSGASRAATNYRDFMNPRG